MRLLIVLLGSLLASSFSSVAFSEQLSPEDIIKQAQERASQISKYRELLSNPDQNVRVAALDVMLKSDDPAMREIAFNIAFVSADSAMRGIALRNKFLYLKTLTFSLELKENASKSEQIEIENKFANAYVVKIKQYDSNTGIIESRNIYFTGQVSGTGMSFNNNQDYCSADMVLNDEVELVGTLNCAKYDYKGSYIIRLRLQ